MLSFAFGWLFAGGSSTAPPIARRRPRVTTVVHINETPIQFAGVRVQRVAGVLDGAGRGPIESLSVPGFSGGRVPTIVASTPRQLELIGVMLDVPLAQQSAALRALELLCSGELELRFAHAPTRVLRGVVSGPIRCDAVDPSKAYVLDAQGCVALQVTIPIVCADGVAYERYPHRVRLSTTPTPVPLDDVAVHGKLVLQGPHSGPLDIDLLTPGGALVRRLALRDAPGLPVSIADGDVVTIHLGAPLQILRRTAAGVVTNALAWRAFAASTSHFFASPRDADPARGVFPRVRVSGASGWWTYARGSAH